MRSRWTPSIVPSDRDATVYVVEDDFGNIGRCFCETSESDADLETTISGLISGQYNDPVRVIAFNTAENWAADVSADIASEIKRRHDMMGEDVPSHIQGFVDQHSPLDRQLALRLVR